MWGSLPSGVGKHSWAPFCCPWVWSKPLTPAGGVGTTGTFAVISILVGNICLQLAPESKFWVYNNVTNKTYVDTAAMEAERLHVSATLACLTAIIQVRGRPWPCQGRSLGGRGADIFPSCCLKAPV